MSIRGTSGKNTLTGTVDNDDIYGLGDDDLIKAGLGDDIIYGDDELSGADDGNDTLYGEGGNDRLYGGAGDDKLYGDGGDDRLYGGAGADKISGGNGADYIGLGAGEGYSGSYVYGNGDVINGGSGIDILNIDYSDYAKALTLSIGDGTSERLLAGNIKVINVEAFEITGTAFTDKITGGNHADTIFGGDGGDTLKGGDREDTLYGENGNDTLYGGEGQDTLQGNAGDDKLYGDIGNDILYGDGGKDTLWGGNQNDQLDGGAGDDIIYGGKGNDILKGGSGGANKLYGDDGNDLIYHDGGKDLLEGGAGNDEYRHWVGKGKATIVDSSGNDRLVLEDFTGNFTAKSAGVTTTLSDGTTFKGIENFTIRAKTDAGRTYTFGSGADILFAGDGNDTIKGGDGNDTLDAGYGKDNVSAGAGNDTVLLGPDAGDKADGGSGTDKVTLSRGYLDTKAFTFSVSGNTAKLSDGTEVKNFERYSVYFGSGNDVVKSVGSALSVEFDGGKGDDTLLGGSGNDILAGGGGSDTIKAGAGNDIITDFWNYDASKNVIDAGAGNDKVSVVSYGYGSDFSVDLGSGNDTFSWFGYENESVTVDGGTGTDLASFDFRGGDNNLTLVLKTSTTMINAPIILKNIERLDIIGGAGNDKFTGGKLADTLAGSSGEDTIHGGDGNDTLGGNNIFGFYSYVDYHFGGDSEQDGYRDKLYGEGGNDEITIASGDIADGGSGVDMLYADFLSKFNNVTFTFTTGKFKLDSTTTADNFEAIHYLGGSSKDNVTGGSRADTLDGNNGNDTLRGGGGNDALLDGLGNDKLYGDAGNDTFTRSDSRGTDFFDGGAGTDTLNFFSPIYSTGSIIIDLAHQSKNGGSAEGLTVKNIENITGYNEDDDIRGDSKANVLSGREGADILVGAGGNDTLNGGGATDWLTGGTGKDKFVFSADSRSHLILVPDGLINKWVYSTGDDDVITDFTRGEDKLVIDASAFGIKDDKITLVTGTDPQAQTFGKPTFLFETDTGRVWFDADGKSSGLAPELIATLQGVTKLSTSDFDFL